MNPTILVTGGAGYIGAHACVMLIAAGFTPLVLDNLCNSSAESLRRVGRITGVEPRLIVADIRDAQALTALFAAQPITAVMHFAGLKAVGESTRDPLRYHDNNVAGSIGLLQAMQRAAVRTLIFSSSATVYGEPGFEQFREDMRCDPVNPYGRGKWMIEQVLGDLAASEAGWRIAALRYSIRSARTPAD
ncbi:UDP-glucose 4-epimerase (Galactowaldenase) [mine drainage metagenome]|uniref:UDP-glucose 4-epimerase n=1 Tax=mine drainage metagenome TaxID=410659 RepID=T1AVW8_9ZZZZ